MHFELLFIIDGIIAEKKKNDFLLKIFSSVLHGYNFSSFTMLYTTSFPLLYFYVITMKTKTNSPSCCNFVSASQMPDDIDVVFVICVIYDIYDMYGALTFTICMYVKRSVRTLGMQPTIVDILQKCFEGQKLKCPVT